MNNHAHALWGNYTQRPHREEPSTWNPRVKRLSYFRSWSAIVSYHQYDSIHRPHHALFWAWGNSTSSYCPSADAHLHRCTHVGPSVEDGHLSTRGQYRAAAPPADPSAALLACPSLHGETGPVSRNAGLASHRPNVGPIVLHTCQDVARGGALEEVMRVRLGRRGLESCQVVGQLTRVGLVACRHAWGRAKVVLHCEQVRHTRWWRRSRRERRW